MRKDAISEIVQAFSLSQLPLAINKENYLTMQSRFIVTINLFYLFFQVVLTPLIFLRLVYSLGLFYFLFYF